MSKQPKSTAEAKNKYNFKLDRPHFFLSVQLVGA